MYVEWWWRCLLMHEYVDVSARERGCRAALQLGTARMRACLFTKRFPGNGGATCEREREGDLYGSTMGRRRGLVHIHKL